MEISGFLTLVASFLRIEPVEIAKSPSLELVDGDDRPAKSVSNTLELVEQGDDKAEYFGDE